MIRDELRFHLRLLGHHVRDKLTGYEGTVGSVSFDVSGCIQAAIRKLKGKKGQDWPSESVWIDTKQLEIVSKAPLVVQPDFVVVPGAQQKPEK